VIKRIYSFVENNKVIIENFSFLSILQVSNLLIFFLLIPFLIKVLGKEYYGIVVFAQTISIYFSIVINFGFNATGTRDVAINRHDPEEISEIVSSILILKVVIFIAMFAVVSVLIFFIPLLKAHPLVFFLSMISCLSDALFPIWYFQGIERMKYITFINVTTRITSALLLFVFVKKPPDYFLVPLFLGIGTVTGATIGLYILFKVHKVKFLLIPVQKLRDCLTNNIPLFISNVSSHIYVNANKLIVGSFLGMKEVAIYDIIDKIVNLLKVPVFMIGQTLFPYISKTKDLHFLKRSIVAVFIFFLIVYTGVNVFAAPLISFFTGDINSETVKLLKLLSLSILPICLSLFLAELILVPFGFFEAYSKMRTSSLLIYIAIIICLVITHNIGLFQLVLTIIFVEIFVVLYSYFLCRKNRIF